MTPEKDLRERFLWVVRGMMMTAGLVLALGLVLHLAGAAAGADRALRAGLVILMATPAFRMVISVAERVRRVDLQFVAVTAVVLFELSLTMWYAATRV